MNNQLFFSAFWFGFFLLSVSRAGEKAENTRANLEFDCRNPDTWQTSIVKGHAQLSSIFKALSQVALDEHRTNDDRRKAVLAIGKIDNEESLAFLVANIDLQIPLKVHKYNDDAAKEMPCNYVLLERNRDPRWRGRNLNIVGAILDSLEKPKNENELLKFAIILKRTFTNANTATDKRAAMFIDFELQSEPEGNRKKNLENLKKILSSHIE